MLMSTNMIQPKDHQACQNNQQQQETPLDLQVQAQVHQAQVHQAQVHQAQTQAQADQEQVDQAQADQAPADQAQADHPLHEQYESASKLNTLN